MMTNVEYDNKDNFLMQYTVDRNERSMLIDPGPPVEMTSIRNENSISTISLSNGITLETNHVDSFVMKDINSGYFFEAREDGTGVFGKDGVKSAVFKKKNSSVANQVEIILKNDNNKEKVFYISFLELKRQLVFREEYIEVLAGSESSRPVLSHTGAYYLGKFSYSMRKILEQFPGGTTSSLEQVTSGHGTAVAASLLSLIGLGLAASGNRPSNYALGVHMMLSFFTVSQNEGNTKEQNVPVERSH